MFILHNTYQRNNLIWRSKAIQKYVEVNMSWLMVKFMLYQILIYALNVIRSYRLPWGNESLMAYILWCIIYANMSICNTLENISSCFPVSCTTTILQISKRNRINSQVKFNDSFTLQVTQFQAHKIMCNNSCTLCTM